MKPCTATDPRLRSAARVSSDNIRRLFAVTAVAVFAALFFFHTYPLGLSDIYWHLNTGRWIVEHRSLPTADPFLYTLGESLDQRQMLLLQGYWLAQVVFYAIHAAFGAWGLILFKAGLFTALYYLLWRILRAARVDAMLILLVLLPLPLLFHRYDELRPQLFSFLGTVLTWACVMRARIDLRAGIHWPPSLLVLPVIMLLWANLHRGYILGGVIIGIALFAEACRQAQKCQLMDPRLLRRYVGVCVVALLATLVNPQGAYAWLIDLQELGTSVYSGVDEFLPLWSYARLYHQPWLFYAPLGIMLVLGMTLFVTRRRISLAELITFVGFAAAGFMSFRFMLLGIVMALIVALPQVSIIWRPYITHARVAMLVTALLGAIGLGALGWQRSALIAGPIESAYVPQAAAEFIRAQQPPAPLFNPYEYGGYLGWELGAQYRLFYDPRSLDNGVYAQYMAAREGQYAEVFARHDVRSVVFYLFTPVLNTVPTLVLMLLNDPQWDVIYLDRLSVVLSRHDAHRFPVIDKAYVWRGLRAVTQRGVESAPAQADTHVEYGRILLFSGEVATAQQEFNEALRLNPQHVGARKHLDAVQRALQR